MKLFNISFLFFLTTALTPNCYALVENIKTNSQMTIYDHDRTLIVEKSEFDLKKGLNTISFSDISDNLIQNSVILKGNNIQVLEQNFNQALVTKNNIFKNSIGKTVFIKKQHPQTGEIKLEEAQLISFMNHEPIVKTKTGYESVSANDIVFNEIPQNLRVNPSFDFSVLAQKNGKETLSLTYLTQGFSWKANYLAYLNENETALDLSAFITLTNNTSSTYQDTTINLVHGDIHTVAVSQNQVFDDSDNFKKSTTVWDTSNNVIGRVNDFADKKFSNFYLYQIPQKLTLEAKQSKQIHFFEKDNIPIQKEYVFDNSLTTLTELKNVHPETSIIIKNDKLHNLGFVIPAGVIRFYKNVDNDTLFVAEDNATQTPINADLILKTGQATDIYADVVCTKNEEINAKTTILGYQMTLKNTSDTSKEIIIKHDFYGKWKIISQSHTGSKENAKTMKWRLHLDPNQEVVFNYQVEETHGN